MLTPTRSRLRLACAVAALTAVATGSACRRAVDRNLHGETAAPASPAAVANELLSADRRWSSEASTRRFPASLAPMFADSVRMPVRDRVLKGRAELLAALASSPDTGSTVRWIPVRVGIGSDGRHGFTAGVQFISRSNGKRVTARYLAYWTREADDTWKVVAWRRRPLDVLAADTTALPPQLPPSLLGRGSNADWDVHRASLVAAEQGFSDLASRIGLGAAFAQLGDKDALNMGRPDQPAFVRGAPAIAALVAGSQPLDAASTMIWHADEVIVASTGDLGITFGVIREKNGTAGGAPGGGSSGSAFFTIWRRSSPGAPWRYVAE